MTETTIIPQKTINNAISAYLMVFISAAFLLNKTDEHTNNPFVRSHTKVAFLIHLSFLINYLIFIHFSFLKALTLFNYSIGYILASSIFILLFMILLYGVYKASKSQVFKIGDILSIGQREKIIDVNGDNTLDEKDKLTLILSHIPFIGYIINGLYFKNSIVKDIAFFNLLVSLFIVLIYAFGYTNVALLLLLFYIIFAVFSSINILSTDTVVRLKLNFIPNPEDKVVLLQSFWIYLKTYFSNKEFIGINQLKNKQMDKRKEKEKYNEDILEEKKDTKLPKNLIYIPVINLLMIGSLQSKQRFHIINGLIITLLFVIMGILNYFYILSPKFNLLFLFPIFFGIGYLQSRSAYKMPFIYNIFEILVGIKKFFTTSKKRIQEKQAEVHDETLKVGEKKEENSAS